MTRDEAFEEYKETLAKLKRERNEAKDLLQKRLWSIQETLHEELKAVRAISQKTKGRSVKC